VKRQIFEYQFRNLDLPAEEHVTNALLEVMPVYP